ncbi:hypothetical protein Glove_53g22 [Diversispora epigaea]|uniref:Elongator complex protein 5 n=1 Tax=Diversispora epigaea TaxID=1348612 RepID=A0A397JNY8_9GLOM|nr:hypothetical protein Glove_53g22 [Diversispora epigaea]
MSTLLLDRILKLKDPLGFVIIKDTILQSGYLIAKEFVKGITRNEKNNIIFLCVESSPQSFLEGIDQQKIIILDAYSQIGGYEKYDKENKLNSNIYILESIDISKIATLIQELCNKLTNSNISLIIESLTPLLLTSVSNTLKFLKKMTKILLSSEESNKNNRIIALYHSDIPIYPTNGTVGLLNINNTLLQQLSMTTIIIKNIEQNRKVSSLSPSFKDERIVNIYNNIPDSGICIIEHRKKSGKIIYETNAYYVDESTGDLKIQPVNEINEESKLENTLDPTTANLLFNLSLTDEQKKEKNKVILPYVKIQDQYEANNPLTSLTSTSGTGTIYYEPDDADDIDEEDPDEDLNL